MSDHEWAHENCDAYLGGGLALEERTQFERHLASCPACKLELAQIRNLEQVMDRLFVSARPDAGLETRAIKRLRQAPRPFRLTGRWRFAIGAAAVIVLGVIGAVVQAVAQEGALPKFALGPRMATPPTTDRSDLPFRDKAKVGGEVKELADRSDYYSYGTTYYSRGGKTGEGEREIFNKRVKIFDDTKSMKPTDPADPNEVPPPSQAAQDSKIPDAPQRSYNIDVEKSISLESTPPKRDEAAYFKPAELAKQDPAQQTPPSPPVDFPPKAEEKPPPDKKAEPKPKEKDKEDGKPPPEEPDSKIIRTGEMEFEVKSFDDAKNSIIKLIGAVKGGFKLMDEGKKQENGKMRGYVIVRMPPQFLDKFVEDVRVLLEKNGELRMQRIGSQDVSRDYTDTKSLLRAARTTEERLLKIIGKGTGDVKALVEAEVALGKVIADIEKMEGQIKFYDNQVAFSTLTINLVEKEIAAAAALVVSGKVQMRIEVDDVTKARQSAEDAVSQMKGRLIRSDEKKHPAGQVEAILHADIPPEKKNDFRRLLEKLGIVSLNEDTLTQATEGGTGRFGDALPRTRLNDVRFEVALNNVANVPARHSVKLEIATADVRDSLAKLKDEILRVAKGQVRVDDLNEQDKTRVTAELVFNVPIDKKPAIDKLIESVGPVLKRASTQEPVTTFATEQKFGYTLTLKSVGSIEPRELVKLHIEVKDAKKSAETLMELVKASNGQAEKVKSGANPQGQSEVLLLINVPLAASDALVEQFKKEGVKVVDWAQVPNSQIPENDLATARIAVKLTGAAPIVPSDEGLGTYVTSSFYTSFRIFAYGLMFIIIGVSAVLPWGLVGFGGYWVYRRFAGNRESTAAAGDQKQAPG